VYDDDAVEVLFDEPFTEGTDLHGKARGRHGGMLPATQLLNLSKPQAVAATGACTCCADSINCVGPQARLACAGDDLSGSSPVVESHDGHPVDPSGSFWEVATHFEVGI
jgi:Xrn1 SH3-like domain